ncbi:MAG TPA: allantoinase AllB [Gemmatimonadaceae bacterium]|nr:allantoinase AllB [Gemmatimonadaceae bacterium]
MHHHRMDLIIRGTRVITSAGMRPATICIADGKIRQIEEYAYPASANETVDAGALIVMPGIVDSHVHVNEPGRTDWEGFETATLAAAAGGVTTLLDMPLNSIPATTTRAALEEKRAAASGKCAINVEFIGGVVPGNSADLTPLRDAGVRAFKCFLTPSGVDEFQNVDEKDLREAFPVLADLGVPLMVHAEDPSHLHPLIGATRSYAEYLSTRPVEAEHAAIELLIRLLEWCPTPVHIVHLSSPSSLAIIAEGRGRGLPITVETCPHYLTFAAEGIPDGATVYKCAPPIRSETERDGLWAGLLAGEIDLIASDHSPCPPALKETRGDFLSAWGGIASIQHGLSAVWTGARARGAGPEQIAEWMSRGPAKLARLDSKGSIDVGYDADIAIWDADASFVVDAASLRQRHRITPYLDHELHGVVVGTWVGGRRVFSDERRLT